MPTTSTSEEGLPVVAPEKIYAEVRTGIRETDGISFRLLGLVPLVSGTALISLVLQTRNLPSGLVILLALFAATITLGLFRWELRNVQTCSWLIKYADALEARALSAKGMGDIFRPRPPAPQRIGKTEAEKLIYATTIVAWLALPVGIGALPDPSYRHAYYLAAGIILAGAAVSLLAPTHVPPIGGLPDRRSRS